MNLHLLKTSVSSFSGLNNLNKDINRFIARIKTLCRLILGKKKINLRLPASFWMLSGPRVYVCVCVHVCVSLVYKPPNVLLKCMSAFLKFQFYRVRVFLVIAAQTVGFHIRSILKYYKILRKWWKHEKCFGD